MRTLQERWESFNSLVINQNAPEIQRTEMRNAFYAGAQALMFGIVDASSEEMTEEAGSAIIEGYHQELADFAVELTNRVN